MKRTKAFFLTILAVMGLCSCGESSEVKPVKLAEDYKTQLSSPLTARNTSQA